MRLDDLTNQVYVVAINEAKMQNHEYLTPEHFLYAALMFEAGRALVEESGGDADGIGRDLRGFFEARMPLADGRAPVETFAFNQMFELSMAQARVTGKEIITIADIVNALFGLHESFAAYILSKNGVSHAALIKVTDAAQKAAGQQARAAEGAAAREGEQNADALKAFTVNLTEKAASGALDPLIGREDVLKRTIQVLCRRTKNNPIHVGDPGVGKTAIVEGLAQLIASGGVPKTLEGAPVLHVDMGALLAGTRFRGDFEERLVKLMESAEKLKNPIIYIDEIHSVAGAGAVGGGGMDAAGIIKPYLQNGSIRFIGSTTFEEYKKFFEKDRALSRRFQKIDVDETGLEESARILEGIKQRYEKFHNVVYTEEIIRSMCELAMQYMNDRHMPDKAIDIMDETGAAARLEGESIFPRLITQKDVERTVARMAKIPEKTVSASETDKLRGLEQELKTEIFGQDEAVETITGAIKLARSGLGEPEKPVANLLFVGPTGVGKTEIARQLARIMGMALQRFDMSEYQERHAVARLIGAPPGYVGYEAGGLMSEAIRKTPNCVLLLDEIEKAHPDILNVLLQVMDYGTLTDNTGKKADFRSVILIMTSNAGAAELSKRPIGFDAKRNAGAVDKEVERLFSPEFRNRLDAVVRFNGVDAAMAEGITRKALAALADKLAGKNVTLTVSEELAGWIARKGLSEVYGAREIIRVVENDLKKALVNKLLFGELATGGAAFADMKDGEIVVTVADNQAG